MQAKHAASAPEDGLHKACRQWQLDELDGPWQVGLHVLNKPGVALRACTALITGVGCMFHRAHGLMQGKCASWPQCQ